MISGLYVVVMAILYMAYSWYLIALKRRARREGVDWPMRHYDRASHGRDFVAQYTPLALLLLAVVELGGAPAPILHLLGSALLAAALLHAHAFGFPARMRSGMIAMLLVTGMYGITCALAVAQFSGLAGVAGSLVAERRVSLP